MTAPATLLMRGTEMVVAITEMAAKKVIITTTIKMVAKKVVINMGMGIMDMEIKMPCEKGWGLMVTGGRGKPCPSGIGFFGKETNS